MTTASVASFARPVVLVRQDEHSSYPRWRNYFVVYESTVTIVEMVRAVLGGWNISTVDSAPASRDWPDMNAEDIVAWKMRNHGSIKCADDEAEHVLAMVARPTGTR